MRVPDPDEAICMEAPLIEALARSLGLERALAAHRDEVIAAAARAAAVRAGIPALRDPTDEPFPPMVPGPRR